MIAKIVINSRRKLARIVCMNQKRRVVAVHMTAHAIIGDTLSSKLFSQIQRPLHTCDIVISGINLCGTGNKTKQKYDDSPTDSYGDNDFQETGLHFSL